MYGHQTKGNSDISTNSNLVSSQKRVGMCFDTEYTHYAFNPYSSPHLNLDVRQDALTTSTSCTPPASNDLSLLSCKCMPSFISPIADVTRTTASINSQFVDFQFLIRCFSFTQCIRQVLLPICIHPQPLTKELDKHDATRISDSYMPFQKSSFGCCAIDRHTFFLALRSSLHLSSLFLRLQCMK